MEFLEAGQTPGERMDAALVRAEIDRLYVTWGLRGVAGLVVDGAEATPETAGGGGTGGPVPRGAGGGAGGDGAERGGTKKLIVAFHFQFANQAGWRCDACRRNGLEKKRRCGWLAARRGGMKAGAHGGLGAEGRGAGPLSEIVHHGGEPDFWWRSFWCGGGWGRWISGS